MQTPESERIYQLEQALAARDERIAELAAAVTRAQESELLALRNSEAQRVQLFQAWLAAWGAEWRAQEFGGLCGNGRHGQECDGCLEADMVSAYVRDAENERAAATGRIAALTALLERAEAALALLKERLEESLDNTDDFDRTACMSCIDIQADVGEDEAICMDHAALDKADATLATIREARK